MNLARVLYEDATMLKGFETNKQVQAVLEACIILTSYAKITSSTVWTTHYIVCIV